MGVGHVVTTGQFRREVFGHGIVAQKLVSGQGRNGVQSRPGSIETGAVRNAHAHAEEAHLRGRTRVKAAQLVEPPVGPCVMCVRGPTTSSQQAHIKKRTHSLSLSTALIRSTVIGGEPLGATSTGRPNLPLISFAPSGSCRSSMSFLSIIVNEILSPGWRFKASRHRVGITNCPFVESVEVSIRNLTRLTPDGKPRRRLFQPCRPPPGPELKAGIPLCRGSSARLQ